MAAVAWAVLASIAWRGVSPGSRTVNRCLIRQARLRNRRGFACDLVLTRSRKSGWHELTDDEARRLALQRLVDAGEEQAEANIISREIVTFARKNCRPGENWGDRLERALKERIQHQTPLQYIIGEWDFHNLKGIRVRKPSLCPRPETEELVSLVLDSVSQFPKRPLSVLEIGSGTGAIALALADSWRKQARGVHITAIDVAKTACELTLENAEIFGLSEHIEVIHASLDEFVALRNKTHGTFDLIVSNPPYIPSRLLKSLDPVVREHEDPRALDGGSDGLDLIRQIVTYAPDMLKPTGMFNRYKCSKHLYF
ncbi:hypothetical protein AAMO2058_001171800 [Amorphochlora amoebiformis]